MPNPQFLAETPLTLVDVQQALQEIEKRDKELTYRSTKTKDYLQTFVTLSPEKKEELHKKLTALNFVRLKEAHIVKIIDFLPKTMDELRILLQAFTLNLPKKEMESIVSVVQEFLK